MAIKKQKRSLEESSASAGGQKSQNGDGQKNKFEKKVKKQKLEKQVVPLQKPAGSPKKIVKENEEEAASPQDATKPAKFLKKNENRKQARRKRGQYRVDGITLNAEEIQQKIKVIEARGNLTKTSKRNLSALRKKLSILNGTCEPRVPQVLNKNAGSAKREKKTKVVISEENLPNKSSATPSVPSKLDKKKAQKKKDKKKATVEPKPKSKESDDDEDEVEEEEEEEDDESAEGDKEESEEEMDQSQDASAEEDDDEDEEEEEEEESEDEDEGEEDTKPVLSVKKMKKEGKTESPTKKQTRPEAANEAGKKKRFVLFVGNLSFE